MTITVFQYAHLISLDVLMTNISACMLTWTGLMILFILYVAQCLYTYIERCMRAHTAILPGTILTIILTIWLLSQVQYISITSSCCGYFLIHNVKWLAIYYIHDIQNAHFHLARWDSRFQGISCFDQPWWQAWLTSQTTYKRYSNKSPNLFPLENIIIGPNIITIKCLHNLNMPSTYIKLDIKHPKTIFAS